MKASFTLIRNLALLSFCTLLFFSCADEKVIIEDVLPEQSLNYYSDSEIQHLSQVLNLPTDAPFEYSVSVPSEIAGSLGKTPIDADLATLGRVLFYDNQVSKNSKVSCGSCHKQELGFADDKAFSEGFAGEHTDRNSLSLGSFISIQQYYDNPINPSSQTGFFWDERASSLAEQMTQTIANEKEMGMELGDLAVKLNSPENMHYRVLFNKAFGDAEIYPARIVSAIESFINSMVTFDSKYDKAIVGSDGAIGAMDEFPNYNAKENLGKKLFMSKCASCHAATISAAHRTQLRVPVMANANNGLDFEYEDQGIGAITNYQPDNGKFKVPVLRNIELTAPYMHDGRFETLEEVVEFYNSGVQNHDNLHPLLQSNGVPKRLNLNAEEKEALVEFLTTFTDQSFITNEKYADPFK